MTDIFRAAQNDIHVIVDFQTAMALETENIILDKETVTNGVAKVIENQQLGCYYVAKVKNEVVACLLTLYEWSDWRNAYVIWIHSVYVLPDHRKNSVFKCFYEYLKKIVTADSNYAGLRLYVEKNNIHAQRVYEKVGMNKNHYELYEWLKSS